MPNMASASASIPTATLAPWWRLNGEIKRSPVGDFLAKHYGQTVSRADFDAAVARAWGPQSVKAFKLTCNGNPAYLTEMQISLKRRDHQRPAGHFRFSAPASPG
ncbi:ribonuclease I [Klebsiella pneumoniae subsp. ozaenae]|uniref:Ribonuclease I n=1 Tax=Klebsiella pneumoniae subsp. ozaenae TaxID=574 RepID=A0A378BUG6_KLEPO|nr:ribonuclease I [Klebsiella pneumoniae subsp. ozaenae]